MNNLSYADDTTFLAENEELKHLLMKVKEESKRVGLKLNIQKTKIMVSSPITSWQIDGDTTGTVTDFTFLSSKITADGDCSHEIKRCLLLGRKGITKLDSILKSIDITFSTKVHLAKAMVFSSSQESPLDCKEIQPVHPKGDQAWVFIGRTDVEAETPILWPCATKS